MITTAQIDSAASLTYGRHTHTNRMTQTITGRYSSG